MYELVLIDADGTLFDYDKAERYALIESIKQFGIDIQVNDIVEQYRKINAALWLDFELGKRTKEDFRTERFRLLFQIYGLTLNTYDFSACYLDYLGHSYFLIDGAEDICRYMSKKYKLYIVTNGIKEVQLTRLEGSTIRKYIDGIVVSEEVGVSKPDPYIFEYALEKAEHSNKESVIMIGDSLSADIKGGINYGIDTCWVNLSKNSGREDIKPKHEIYSLMQLMKVI